ncbi:MAG: beta-lactamase family protein [Legionella sp.]|nr:beta-lactamase family protein [Legionella sp.]
MIQLRLILFIQLCICMNAHGQNRLTDIQKFFPKIDQAFQAYADKNHIPGYAFGLKLDGKLIYSNSHGYINLKDKIPATQTSVFRIASMTKSFTALAILRLRDENKLQLEDRIDSYIPELKNQKLVTDTPPITIRNVLTQFSRFSRR